MKSEFRKDGKNKSPFRYKKIGKNKYEYEFMSWDEWEQMMKEDEVKRERMTMSKKERTEMIKEIVEAYLEARQYDDRHLYTDHFSWLKHGFEEGWFEYPDDYDFDSNRWTIGFQLAQIERYGGIVMETKKGLLPYVNVPNEYETMDDTDGDLQDKKHRRVGKRINEYLTKDE